MLIFLDFDTVTLYFSDEVNLLDQKKKISKKVQDLDNKIIILTKKLDNKGIFTTVVDARFAKPLDEKLIMDLSLNHEALITIEEGSIGGFGSHVMQMLSERGIFDKGLKMRSMILPDKFIDQDTPELMYKKAGLDCDSIIEKVEDVLKSNFIIEKNTIKKLS